MLDLVQIICTCLDKKDISGAFHPTLNLLSWTILYYLQTGTRTAYLSAKMAYEQVKKAPVLSKEKKSWAT